jgi:hypothetical protein
MPRTLVHTFVLNLGFSPGQALSKRNRDNTRDIANAFRQAQRERIVEYTIEKFSAQPHRSQRNAEKTLKDSAALCVLRASAFKLFVKTELYAISMRFFKQKCLKTRINTAHTLFKCSLNHIQHTLYVL